MVKPLEAAIRVLDDLLPNWPSRLAAAKYLHQKGLFSSLDNNKLGKAFTAIAKQDDYNSPEIKLNKLGATGIDLSSDHFKFTTNAFHFLQLLEDWYRKERLSGGKAVFIAMNSHAAYSPSQPLPALPPFENLQYERTLLEGFDKYCEKYPNIHFAMSPFLDWVLQKIPIARLQYSLNSPATTPIAVRFLSYHEMFDWGKKKLNVQNRPPPVPPFLRDPPGDLRRLGFHLGDFAKIPLDLQNLIGTDCISALLFDTPYFTISHLRHMMVLRGFLPLDREDMPTTLNRFFEIRTSPEPVPINSTTDEVSDAESAPAPKKVKFSPKVEAAYAMFGKNLDGWVKIPHSMMYCRLVSDGVKIAKGLLDHDEPGFTIPPPCEALLNYLPFQVYETMCEDVLEYLLTAARVKTDEEYNNLSSEAITQFKVELDEFASDNPSCSIISCDGDLSNEVKLGRVHIERSIYDIDKSLCIPHAMLAVLCHAYGASEQDFEDACYFLGRHSSEGHRLVQLFGFLLRCLGGCGERLLGQDHSAFCVGTVTRFGAICWCWPCANGFSKRLSVDKDESARLYDNLKDANPNANRREIRLLMPPIDPPEYGQTRSYRCEICPARMRVFVAAGYGKMTIKRFNSKGQVVCRKCLAPQVQKCTLTPDETRDIVSQLVKASTAVATNDKPMAVLARYSREFKRDDLVGIDPIIVLNHIQSKKGRETLSPQGLADLQRIFAFLSED